MFYQFLRFYQLKHYYQILQIYIFLLGDEVLNLDDQYQRLDKFFSIFASSKGHFLQQFFQFFQAKIFKFLSSYTIQSFSFFASSLYFDESKKDKSLGPAF